MISLYIYVFGTQKDISALLVFCCGHGYQTIRIRSSPSAPQKHAPAAMEGQPFRDVQPSDSDLPVAPEDPRPATAAQVRAEPLVLAQVQAEAASLPACLLLQAAAKVPVVCLRTAREKATVVPAQQTRRPRCLAVCMYVTCKDQRITACAILLH